MRVEIAGAVRRLGILKFFPADSLAREEVMRQLEKIVDSPARLNWLVDTLIDTVGEWPGPAQLRALYATRYRPADGLEGTHCTIGGFTPADSESAFLGEPERQKQISERDHREARGLVHVPTTRLQ